MFFLLTLPFRIFFGIVAAIIVLPLALLALPFALLLIPFLLVRLVLKAAVLVLPFVALAAVFALGLGLFVVLCVMLAPLLPFAVIGLIVWAIVRASRPAYAA